MQQSSKSSTPFLEVQNLYKSFGPVEVLQNINLSLKEGEFFSLLGASGCGKTTLLRIIAGLEQQNKGDLLLKGEPINSLSPKERQIAMVFQSYALIPHMTALQNISYGLSGLKLPKKEVKERSIEALKLVQLEYLADRYPTEMSGGQQQRISLARAIAIRPSILLLDEPLSALDAKVRDHLRAQMKMISQSLNITTILVTHDQEEALSLSDRVAVMHGGEIIQVGTPEELYHSPKNDFVANFVGLSNTITGEQSTRYIRPESLPYSWEPKAQWTYCTIDKFQFRGATFRLFLKSESEDFIIDLSSHSINSHELREKKGIYVNQGLN